MKGTYYSNIFKYNEIYNKIYNKKLFKFCGKLDFSNSDIFSIYKNAINDDRFLYIGNKDKNSYFLTGDVFNFNFNKLIILKNSNFLNIAFSGDSLEEYELNENFTKCSEKIEDVRLNLNFLNSEVLNFFIYDRL